MSRNTYIPKTIRYGLCFVWIGLLGLLVGCNALESPTPQATPIIISKLLATAYISPTPNEEQLQATALVVSPAFQPLPSRTPQATIYMGVFLGETQLPVLSPRIDPQVFAVAPAPTIVPAGSDCQIPIGEEFQGVWLSDDIGARYLGCPIQISFGFFGNGQFFENGIIYQSLDTRELWAVQPSAELGHYWYLETVPEISTESIVAPLGLIVPTEDIGSMWLGVAGLRDELGFARTGSQRISMGLQRFERGAMLLDATSGQIFVLRPNGDALGPF